jgi:flavin-dependent dehydrogenase
MGGKFFADALVIGAGPAGLGTALALARHGVDVAVLEMQDRIGAKRRGETIRFDRKMDGLLGEGFFAKQTIRRINRRSYFSHTGLRRVDRTIDNPNLIISWPDFIQAMACVAEAAGARILPASTVVGFIREQGRIAGVRAMVGGFMEEELKTKAVFSCGGCEDPASRVLSIDRAGMDMPVSKRLVRGYTGPADRFEYHFHVHGGSLTIATIFPRAKDEAEIILMGYAWGRKPGAVSFDEFTQAHEVFRERLEGTTPFYSLKTAIPMGRMISPCCPEDRLVMAGDVLGHVQSRGGSGIRTSFLLGYTAGRLGARALQSGAWTADTTEKLEQGIQGSPPMRDLRRHNLIYSTLRAGIFGRIRDLKHMDRLWPLLRIALR